MKGNKMLPVLALGVAGWAAGMPAAARVKPHVILIMTDQQRWDAMGCTSGGRVITPALDSLAAEAAHGAFSLASRHAGLWGGGAALPL